MADKFLTVATFETSIEAGFAKSLLESDGVQVFLVDEHTTAMNWGCNLALGGIKLKVFKEDAEKASKIMKEISDSRKRNEENEHE